MRIGIDLMGSDSPPHILFTAVQQAAKSLDFPCIFLVIATKPVLAQLPSSILPLSGHVKIQFHEAEDMIGMDEDPILAIRHKKNSSLVCGIRLLKKGEIDAFVSCGNTGALIAGAVLTLPLLPGIKRPALLANLPTEKGLTATLDVGSTVACKASFLVQFAHLGAAYQRVVKGIAVPTVGLLNVGIESKKGTMEVREAYECLRKQGEAGHSGMNFIGNIEARDVFKGFVDVLVTDGFTGNVLLKTAEGVADLIFGTLENGAMERSVELQKLRQRFDYAEYPGAMLCGVEGVVIKVHGNGSPKALLSSILGAADFVRKDVVAHLKKELQA